MREEVRGAPRRRHLAVVAKGRAEALDDWQDLVDGTDEFRTDVWQRLMAFVLDMSQIGAWEIDPSSHIVRRTPNHDRIFGYQSPLLQWTEETFLRHVLPEDLEKVRGVLAPGGNAHNDAGLEFRIRRADGEIRWMWTVGKRRLDPDGGWRIAGIIQDITDRKASEDALRTSEERLKKTLLSIPDAFAINTFPGGEMIAVNGGFERAFGYSEAEVLGKTSFDLGMWVDYSQRDKMVEALRAEGVIHDFELMARRRDGTVFPALLSAATVGLAEEGLMVALTKDITSHKEVERQLEASLLRARASEAAAIKVLSSVTEMRDPYTAGHQRRVAELCVAIAEYLGMPEEQKLGLETAALLHDVGKVSVPIEILACPNALSPVQIKLVEGHVQAGYEILRGMTGPSPVAQIVLQHHERLDGSGYPAGLKGDEILPEARIIAVADSAEAISSDRPYRPARGIEAAREELVTKRGVLYDPEVVDACLAVIATGFGTT
jgi:PAS domain S-box-containing protein/putative nucleotidyltransferase with HDIG domain